MTNQMSFEPSTVTRPNTIMIILKKETFELENCIDKKIPMKIF